MTTIKTVQELKAALDAMIRGSGKARKFVLTQGALGSVNIDRLLAGYLARDSRTLTLTAPTEPTIDGETVTFSGTAKGVLGVDGTASLRFDLADEGAPSMLLDLPVADTGWRLTTSFPAWDMGTAAPLAKLAWSDPVLWFTSIDRNAEGSRPALTAFVDLAAASVDLSGIVGVLASLPGAPKFTDFTSAVAGPLDAPLVTLASAHAASTAFGYLDLPLTFSAIASTANPFDKTPSPPPPVYTYLRLSAALALPQPTTVPPVPVSMDFTALGALLRFEADLRSFSKYALREFAGFVNKAPIDSYLDQYIKLTGDVELRDLAVTVDTDGMSLAAVSLTAGTSHALTVVKDYVEIPDITVSFTVNDPLGTKSIFATITGEFDFLRSIPVRVTGSYPQMLFTGGLVTDTPLTIKQVFGAFLPGATDIPNIDIDELLVTADLTGKTYGFQFAVSSEWKIPVGIAEIELAQASLALSHTTGAERFSGEIAATANVYDSAGTLFATFFMDWTLPGSFLLEGTFPEIDLSELAEKLVGGYLPSVSGLPQIHLTDTKVQLTITTTTAPAQVAALCAALPRAAGGTVYDFTASTRITVQKFGEIDLFFELVRGSDSGDGFVAGLLVAPTWTPDEVWSGLKPVFDVIAITDAGVILSSLDGPTAKLSNFSNLPYVPDKIGKGVTFFAELSLVEKALEPLGLVFPKGTALQLSAFIDTSDLKKSDIKAKLPAAQIHKNITWDGLTLDLQPGQGKFTLSTAATFCFQSEQLSLAGAGTIAISATPSVTIGLSVAEWEEPFGIHGLTIKTFGMTAGLDETGVTIGLLGSFEIGEGPDQFTLTVGGEILDFEAPGALVFALDASAKRLDLTTLIKQFTDLDLSQVPLLNGLAFKSLDFYVVDDPSGWTAPPPDNHLYPPGIGLNADIFFYDFELTIFAQVEKSVGIIASGKLNKKIDLLGVLVISDETGKTGPSASINTSSLAPGAPTPGVMLVTSPQYRALVPAHALAIRPINPLILLSQAGQEPYFAFSGGIDLMGLERLRFSGSATDKGFEVNFAAELANILTAHFRAAYSSSTGLMGHADGNFDFHHTFTNGLSVSGIKIIPDDTTIDGPNAALWIDVRVNSSKAKLALALSFHWRSISFDLHFTLDAQKIAGLLKNLFTQIITWIEDNVTVFLQDILKDPKSFIAWIAFEGEALALDAITVARMLSQWFNETEIENLAEQLIAATIYGLYDMANALVYVFGVGFPDAVALLEKLMDKVCEVEKTQSLIYSVEPNNRIIV